MIDTAVAGDRQHCCSMINSTVRLSHNWQHSHTIDSVVRLHVILQFGVVIFGSQEAQLVYMSPQNFRKRVALLKTEAKQR
jgi:hypothetical protein